MGKVLIIDDEKQILSLLSRIIGLEGYDVFQAASCKAGIKQLEQNDPEVVLCDVCLPDGSGVELVTELKRLRPLSEVILLTAHGNIPDGVQAIKNGAFDYITKGDDNNKILPLIAKAMEKATAAYQQQKTAGTAVGKQYSFATVIGRSCHTRGCLIGTQGCRNGCSRPAHRRDRDRQGGVCPVHPSV